MNLDQSKLIKLLQLTLSSNDGEALSAIRKANAALDKAGLNWESYFATFGRASSTFPNLGNLFPTGMSFKPGTGVTNFTVFFTNRQNAAAGRTVNGGDKK